MSQYEQNQKFFYLEACKLASQGEEFAHLNKMLTPEYALRLRIFVQQLPAEIASKTIYGRAHCKPSSKKK